MTRAVPGSLSTVPSHHATEVATDWGDRMHGASLIPVGCNPFSIHHDDLARAAGEFLQGRCTQRGESITDKALGYVEVLGDECLRRVREVKSGRIEECRPGIVPTEDGIRDQYPCEGSGRHPPLLEAGGNMDLVRASHQSANVGHVVGGHVVLRRPAVVDRTDWKPFATPGLQGLIPQPGV